MKSPVWKVWAPISIVKIPVVALYFVSELGVYVVPTLVICNAALYAGSVVRGYGWVVAPPSSSHLNMIDSPANLTVSPFPSVWAPI